MSALICVGRLFEKVDSLSSFGYIARNCEKILISLPDYFYILKNLQAELIDIVISKLRKSRSISVAF